MRTGVFTRPDSHYKHKLILIELSYFDFGEIL